jgi:hypothetical protein
MPHHAPFPLNRQASLVALISAAFSSLALAAPAARVDFAVGEVNIAAPDGALRKAEKGAELNQGETINTLGNGRAQIRFTDGAFMSLQPNTSFKVDEYSYAGREDGKEKGFFSLIKGAMRTITGAIGRKNQDTYQVKTSYATIGIRGTGYTASLTNPLIVKVNDGAIILYNKAGDVVLTRGQSGIVRSPDDKPERTDTEPVLPPAQTWMENTELVENERREWGEVELQDFLSAVAPGFTSALQPSSSIPLYGFSNVSSVTHNYSLDSSSGTATASSGSLNATFSPLSDTVSASLSLSTNQGSLSGSGDGTFPNFSSNSCPSCTFQGFIAGSNAERAYVNYTVNSSSGSADFSLTNHSVFCSGVCT